MSSMGESTEEFKEKADWDVKADAKEMWCSAF